MGLRISVILLLLPLLAGLPRCMGSEAALKPVGSSEHARLDISAVTQLLDVFDLIHRKNPGYKAALAGLSKVAADSGQREIERLTARNSSDPEISNAIQKLLDSPTYRLYYRQFRNVTPEIHRQVLTALPYRAIPSPGDIGSSLYAMYQNRDSVRAWVTSVISLVDLDTAHQVALRWLPPGEYAPPVIHFFCDGNADAFAHEGEVGFDLYGTILSLRPAETRFSNLGTVGKGEIEGILAHELHHIYSARYLYPPGREYATWRDQWKDRLIRQIVSEGVAMQCNPLQGLRRTLREDTVVVRYWIGQLNEKLAALQGDSISEPRIQEWYERSFHETATMLLNDYRKRAAPAEDSAAFMRQHIAERPSMIYTLGWWMVGRILEMENGREKVIQLLTSAPDLFAIYNGTGAGSASGFKVDD